MLKPREWQQLLIDNGFALPKFGADGFWGDETNDAAAAWFETGKDLMESPDHIPDKNVIPPEWLPDCTMSRIINHWTAGAYKVSQEDREHYHFIIGGDLVLVRGDYSIKANVSVNDADGYAAHVNQFNTGSIGISSAAMAGAVENPFNPGQYPLQREQWEMAAQVAAECCRKYGITVTPTTVLQHGEVQKNCGVQQNGKWDCNKLPWQPGLTSEQACDAWREEVRKRI